MTAQLSAPEVTRYRSDVERAKKEPASLVTLGLDGELVRMSFFRPISFMGISPEQADQLAAGLKAWAKAARKVRTQRKKQ